MLAWAAMLLALKRVPGTTVSSFAATRTARSLPVRLCAARPRALALRASTRWSERYVVENDVSRLILLRARRRFPPSDASWAGQAL